MHLHCLRGTGESGDWRDVPCQNEIDVFLEGRVDGIRCPNQEERIAVWGDIHHCLGADITVCTGPILNEEWLRHLLR
jgi:hypothetical protein